MNYSFPRSARSVARLARFERVISLASVRVDTLWAGQPRNLKAFLEAELRLVNLRGAMLRYAKRTRPFDPAE